MGVSRPRRGLRWLTRIVVAAVVIVVIGVMVTAARGVYDVSPYPVAVASAPRWTMPCFHSVGRYNHEPQCARVRGRVVWREGDDPDGDGDRHIVVLSRMRFRVVKLTEQASAMPPLGSEVEAVGFTTVGASGEREIVAEAFWR